MDLNRLLLDQLTFHWDHHLRPKLEGLTDEEYLWEPVAGMWSIRPRGEARAPIFTGVGDVVAEFELPEPDPAPVTTIAWRLGHIIVGVFGMRNASHFDGPAVDYTTADWAPDAATALAQLDVAYEWWVKGAAGLGEAGLERAVGESEGPFAEHPYASLLLHIHREVIHHGAEVLLLRDLYRASHGTQLAAGQAS
jgi:hypothetical protein